MEAGEEADFSRLPPEIIEKIFLSAKVTETELCNLSRTCSTFRDILFENKLWKKKCLQRWPELLSCLQTHGKESKLYWKSMYRNRFLLKKDVGEKLKELSYKTHHGQDEALLIMEEGNFYDFGKLPVFSKYFKSGINYEQKMALISSELLEVYHEGDKYQNLNARYFADKSLSYLCHLQLEPEIKAYASKPSERRDIEEAAFFIAKWFQPTLTFSLGDVKGKLDKLAAQVKSSLFDMHPKHPIFNTRFDASHTENLTESSWNVRDCRMILSAIEHVLKPVIRKDDIVQQYYVAENSFINIVLECYRGIPITLSLLVMAVARRLGLLLQPVNFPRHFILRWTEHPARSGLDRYTFIDVFNGDYSLTYRDLIENFSMPRLSPSPQDYDSCTMDDVLKRMLRNLVALGRNSHQDGDMIVLHRASELFTLFFPDDLRMSLLEIEIQLHLGINIPKAISVIEDLASAVPWMQSRLCQLESKCRHMIAHAKQKEKRPELKKRGKHSEVIYSVGMVMKHRRYDYLCVIYGWDSVCKASKDWIKQMGVNKQQERQPFYNVLVMDGTNRYACQENLQFTVDTCEITHPMVGKYFDSFNGQYYTPCESIGEIYPDDAEVTVHDVTEFFISQSDCAKEESVQVMDQDS